MKTRNAAATCETCPYAMVSDLPSRPIVCLRNAPVPDIRDNDDGSVLWPLTHPYNVCGEHPDFFLEDGSALTATIPAGELKVDQTKPVDVSIEIAYRDGETTITTNLPSLESKMDQVFKFNNRIMEDET